MIFVKAKDMNDLRQQFQDSLHYKDSEGYLNRCWKDKVKFHERNINDQFIRLTYGVDDITIRIPTKYKDRNIFLCYTDEYFERK